MEITLTAAQFRAISPAYRTKPDGRPEYVFIPKRAPASRYCEGIPRGVLVRVLVVAEGR